MSDFSPVVLAGGKGVRLWPVSRETMPKPYVRTTEIADTPLQATLRRVSGLGGHEPPLVVCNSEHDFVVSSQAQVANSTGVRLLLEPEGRNTAAAICAAALVKAARGSDAPMLVLPADHTIADAPRFAAAVASGVDLAGQGFLVTFAIKPAFPATGYGYLEIGEALVAEQKQYRIAAFVEKPDAECAMRFVESGRHAWNSGMFVFRPSVVIRSFEQHRSDILEACREALHGVTMGEVIRLGRAAFLRAPAISIDYAIMEKASNVATVLADFGWSDVGDWQAVWSSNPRDAQGNVVSGHADAVESSGSLVHSDGPLLVALGVTDMIAVATKDAVIVAPRTRAQDVKMAVERLKSLNLPEALGGKKVLRPWGSFERLHAGPGFEVKELTVLPGASLSLQRHRFRCEHWVCTSGEGQALREGQRLPLTAGTSVFIPEGAIHRLENSGTEVLKIVETQIGSYLGEDDIERLEDVYGRA